MSDLGRKSLAEQAEQKITPDSSKSTIQKASESITGAADKTGPALQSDSQKSTSQSLGDSSCGTANATQSEAHGLLTQAKDSIAKGANVAGAQIQAGINAITGATAQDKDALGAKATVGSTTAETAEKTTGGKIYDTLSTPSNDSKSCESATCTDGLHKHCATKIETTELGSTKQHTL